MVRDVDGEREKERRGRSVGGWIEEVHTLRPLEPPRYYIDII